MKKKGCCGERCLLVTGGILGVILVVLGACLVYTYDSIVRNQMKISEGTGFYGAWEVTTVPIYLEFYMFNLTNAEEFLTGDKDNFVKPNFEQLGPYVYREHFYKDSVDFLDVDPQIVRYQSKGYLTYEAERTVGSIQDKITTLEFIAVSVPSMLQYLYTFSAVNEAIPDSVYRAILVSINRFFRNNDIDLTFTHTVDELLFGFYDPVLDKLVDLVNDQLASNNISITIPYQTFGLFGTYNDSAPWYAAYTGVDDSEMTNYLAEYQNKTELSYWWGDECNMINGTDGTTFPPFMSKEGRKYMFVDDICRSLYATYTEDVTIETVPGWLFVVPPEVFKSPSSLAENLCYCPNQNLSIAACNYDGGLLLASCLGGAPIFMTSPNFLYADHYLSLVEGLEYIEDQHNTPLVYDPITGANLMAAKRLQINIYMEPMPEIKLLDTWSVGYAFPILWVNESYTMSAEDGKDFYRYVVQPQETFQILQIVFCIVGSALLLGGIFYVSCQLLNKNKNKTTNRSDSGTISSFSKSNYSVKLDENSNGGQTNGQSYENMQYKKDEEEIKTSMT